MIEFYQGIVLRIYIGIRMLWIARQEVHKGGENSSTERIDREEFEGGEGEGDGDRQVEGLRSDVAGTSQE